MDSAHGPTISANNPYAYLHADGTGPGPGGRGPKNGRSAHGRPPDLLLYGGR